jgi:glycosyltransferase involved in cell wall biosynthesis
MNGRPEGLIPEGLVIQTNDDISLREKALELLKDDITGFRLSHLARRKIYASHTYAHRIRTICDSLKIEHDWEEYPLASVIVPTKRPELIPSCLDKFRNQNYPNKELIIAINTDAVDMEAVRGQVSEFPDVRVYQMHQEKNIGICLNVGVNQASGKYWFKMDDDDFYGTHYLQDMIHLCDTADFHIMGKPRGFIYMEDEDRVYLRGESIQSQHIIGSMNAPHLTGATLGGIRDFFPGFSENHRACVDTRFVEGGRAQGLTIMCGDIWNFIAFRAEDKSKHTWRHDNEDITKKAVSFYEGLRLDKIMI